MARNCPHFKIFETLDCLHQSGAGHKPAGPAKQKRLAHQAVGKTAGRLIRAKRETKRAAGSNNPAKLSQSQMGIGDGFQSPSTRHKIEGAILKRQGLQPSLYLWHGNVGAACKHRRGRVEKGHQIRWHTLGNQGTCQIAGAAASIQELRIRRRKCTHQAFQGSLRLAACMTQPAMMKFVIARCEFVIKINRIACRSFCQHLVVPGTHSECPLCAHFFTRNLRRPAARPVPARATSTRSTGSQQWLPARWRGGMCHPCQWGPRKGACPS